MMRDEDPGARRVDPIPRLRYRWRVTLYLVRHGETRENAARIVQLPGVPLSDRGLAQARQVARRLAKLGITRVLSSDLARAAMTARAIVETTGAALSLEPLLRERDFGDVRGTPYVELPADIFAPDYVPPRGESRATFEDRVASAWRHVTGAVDAADGSIAVVTHGLVLGALAVRHLALPADVPPPARWENTSVTEVEGTPPWRVRALNCCAHLSS
jgi:2,3-bisphosphoglycerate-dependent phosphoglycerate mutase